MKPGSTLEKRSFDSELRADTPEGDDETRKIVGHAAVFNKESEEIFGFREVILPGTFKQSLRQDDIRALKNHNDDHILGRKHLRGSSFSDTLKLNEDERGLAFEIDPPDTTYARDLMVNLERGDVTQTSFRFRVVPGGDKWTEHWNEAKKRSYMLRTISRAKVFEVSPVTFPAYPQTDVSLRALLGVKGVDYDGIQEALRSLGQGQELEADELRALTQAVEGLAQLLKAADTDDNDTGSRGQPDGRNAGAPGGDGGQGNPPPGWAEELAQKREYLAGLLPQ